MIYRMNFSLATGTAHVTIDVHDTDESPFPIVVPHEGDEVENVALLSNPSKTTGVAGVRSLNPGLTRIIETTRCIVCANDFVVDELAQLADEMTEEYAAFVTTCPNCHPMAALCFQGDICV